MIVTRTPFRMSFFGGGTDFPDFYRLHGGTVLSATFDKYCYVSLRHLPSFFDFNSEFVYSKTERVKDNEEIVHPAIRAAMQWQRVEHVRMTYDADLPARAGLGSSSAFAVGLMHAIHAARGENIDARTLADEAVYLERTLCDECGGVQDQIATAFGGFNRIDFDDNGYTVMPVSIDDAKKTELCSRLMLFFTGTSRFSAELQVAHQAALSRKQKDLCRMRDMAREASAWLENGGALDVFGDMLDEAWQIKRSITDRVSNAEIDAFYRKARAAGARGGKLLGAGGSGFLLFYVPRDRQYAVREALRGLIEIPFSFENEGTRVIYRKQEPL